MYKYKASHCIISSRLWKPGSRSDMLLLNPQNLREACRRFRRQARCGAELQGAAVKWISAEQNSYSWLCYSNFMAARGRNAVPGRPLAEM